MTMPRMSALNGTVNRTPKLEPITRPRNPALNGTVCRTLGSGRTTQPDDVSGRRSGDQHRSKRRRSPALIRAVHGSCYFSSGILCEARSGEPRVVDISRSFARAVPVPRAAGGASAMGIASPRLAGRRSAAQNAQQQASHLEPRVILGGASSTSMCLPPAGLLDGAAASPPRNETGQEIGCDFRRIAG